MAFDSKLLDGMVIFVEVVDVGSFTLAAQRSGHSTSYISKEINKLENRLGVRLLQRTTRTIRLTYEGEIYYQQARHIIDSAQQAVHDLSGRQAEPQGELKISCPVSFGLSRIRPIIAKFMAKYPQITINVDLSDKKVDVVADGFDVVIRATSQLQDSSLVCRKFMTAKALTLAAPSYIKEYGMPTTPQDLAEHKVLTYSYLKHPQIWSYFDSEGREQLVHLKTSVTSSSPELLLELCVAGQGIIRLPTFNLTDELDNGTLVPMLNDYGMPDIGVYLIYASRQHLPAKIRVFIDFILEELGNS
ncbi:LysR family transcriptional regulator [Psychrosphaera sp. B3R10]|uniref:LysR family transcriptional regulator n=1 Tax=Psychrosphaera algicola TaxID=3023714 RepID=A0ABT5FIW1_9GAMM|nr:MULTISPECIES: LysR family transcriptional regulator [unclassified Psychrosphaera]MBU2882873.1 LysR family transcriptional regulator [Psychrosphaera sp. I2R16]MBU2990388.1 LysR family transcriptional regulator [Psychrosphaera sp. B3R10]MDC2891138.1 LysR family transcriptional regulator [Psychrosphaera sp. G1-22]MDO6718639.1 LysR family transcriptional regulator [Psychrosphaera sp. 1_MG-2023]